MNNQENHRKISDQESAEREAVIRTALEQYLRDNGVDKILDELEARDTDAMDNGDQVADVIDIDANGDNR